MIRFVNTFLTKTQSEQVRKEEGLYPIGHYYSPIPSKEDIDVHLDLRKPLSHELPDIEMNRQHQRDLLDDYMRYYEELPFQDEKTAGDRYYYLNPWFSYADAIFLYCFLRKHMPRRIIEVGSGFSSAAMMDTVDGFFSQRPEMTCIDPDPGRLISIMKEGDRNWVKLIEGKIQEVPSNLFSSLESGDLLFIDSSHVMKCGNDLYHLMFEILPHLPSGVFVHFHDVFYPFDYPPEWLLQGRYWNENYFLRAFLAYNYEWSIYFFNTYMHLFYRDVIAEKLPLCAKNPGGSLYIQRTLTGNNCSHD
jgi:predicted O-methyltransferase YrrM